MWCPSPKHIHVGMRFNSMFLFDSTFIFVLIFRNKVRLVTDSEWTTLSWRRLRYPYRRRWFPWRLGRWRQTRSLHIGPPGHWGAPHELPRTKPHKHNTIHPPVVFKHTEQSRCLLLYCRMINDLCPCGHEWDNTALLWSCNDNADILHKSSLIRHLAPKYNPYTYSCNHIQSS